MSTAVLVVGLGNPGPRYAGSPHNAGFQVLDQLHSLPGAGPWQAKGQGLVSRASLADCELVLLKPQTYMNSSGHSVKEVSTSRGIGVESVFVVHDDLDLPLGRLKLKTGGGDGGHNGLRSITTALGSNGYNRLRVGVGPVPSGLSGTEYLLTPLSEQDAEALTAAALQAVSAFRMVCERGLSAAMSSVNQVPKEVRDAADPGARDPE